MGGIDLQFSPVEAYKAIGIVERYHAPLSRIYSTVRSSYSRLSNNMILRFLLNATNDTMGPEGLVPLLLVFGVVP